MAKRNGEAKGPPTQPMNVEQIVKKAQNFDYNPLIPLKYWLRTAATLLKEADIYDHEGNDQQTYLLLFRHAELVLRNLRNHPQAELPEGRQALLVAEKEVVSSLGKLELLKPRINKKFQRFEQLVKEREARKPFSPIRKQSIASEFASLHYGRMATDPAMAGFDETIAAGDNPDLAVKLAHTEIRRRATRKATRQAGIPEEVEQARRTAGVWGEWDKAFSRDDDDGDREALSRQMQSIRLQTAEKKDPSPVRGRKASLDKVEHSYRYPEVPSRKTWSPPPPPPLPRIVTSQDTSDRKPPLPPPKDALVFSPVSGPAIPKKIPFPSSDLTTPTVNGTSSSEFRPSSVIIQPSAYLENGSPLRTMYLDPDLRHRFLSIAEPNTRANLETCGVLCGTLISNALFIRKLVIPEQKSTSDTCETVNESALFDYVDGEDLMVLGWIHTHPTQTCFMSSRDLHTHAGYQVMMSESIAIVCAPSKDDWGVFRLTDPPGMKSVLNCTQSGLFHPHAESGIYTSADQPGHVREAPTLGFEVVDQRPKA